MDLIAKIAPCAAYIYQHTYNNDNFIAPNENLDYGANFAHMLGFND